MLTARLRTIDLKEIINLWENDKEALINELLSDYNRLKREYRKLSKEYTKNAVSSLKGSETYISKERINYQKELGLDEYISGYIKITKDIKENVETIQKMSRRLGHDLLARESYVMQDIVRLKAKEIAEFLKDLKIKVNYTNDFETHLDEWLHEDLEELERENCEN